MLKENVVQDRNEKNIKSQYQKRALHRLLEGKVGISYRWLGRKFNRENKAIKKDIADMGYERRKRVNAPKVTKKQKIT